MSHETRELNWDAILIHLKRLAIDGRDSSTGHFCIARNKCEAIINSITEVQKKRKET